LLIATLMCGGDVTNLAWRPSVLQAMMIACTVAVARYSQQWSLSMSIGDGSFVDSLEQICLEEASEIGDGEYSG
jgi:hypothetical protein